MPRGNYSYSENREERFGQPAHAYSGDESPRRAAITEPTEAWARPGSSLGHQRGSEMTRTVRAKEPDRPSATRRGTSSHNRLQEDAEQNDQPRRRMAPRASGRATQARRASYRGAPRRASAPEPRTGRQKKSRRGFAAMSAEQQREIARKGGLTVSRNRRHMADIGRVGGEHSHGGRRTKARR